MGYGALRCAMAGTCLFFRNELSFNDRFPSIVSAVRALPATNVVLDGELVGMIDRRPDFGALQHGSAPDIEYWVFDMPWLLGQDLRHLPIEERKGLLVKAVPDEGAVRVVPTLEGEAGELFTAACRAGLGRSGGQAGRLSIPGRPLVRLAQAQMRVPPGDGDRRLHGTSGVQETASGPCYSGIGRVTTLSTPARWGPGLLGPRSTNCTRPCRSGNGRRAPSSPGQWSEALAGWSRALWPRSSLATGPATAAFVTPVLCASGRTRPATRSCERSAWVATGRLALNRYTGCYPRWTVDDVGVPRRRLGLLGYPCNPRRKSTLSNTNAKEQAILLEGTVVESLKNATFRVKTDNGHEVLAHNSGKMRMHRIRVSCLAIASRWRSALTT